MSVILAIDPRQYKPVSYPRTPAPPGSAVFAAPAADGVLPCRDVMPFTLGIGASGWLAVDCHRAAGAAKSPCPDGAGHEGGSTTPSAELASPACQRRSECGRPFPPQSARKPTVSDTIARRTVQRNPAPLEF
jgi:hypothetical protein